MSRVWCDLPDSALSTLSGRGMKNFVKGAAGETFNIVFVYPRVSSGALAEYMRPDDVCLMLRDDAGSLIDARVTVKHVPDRGLQLAFILTAQCANRPSLSMSVTVCGVPFGPPVTVLSGYDAINGTSLAATFDVGVGEKGGMAVNADGSMMAVSFGNPTHQVHVFRLTPSFEQVRVIGKQGNRPAEFQQPVRLCFADADSLLVCDLGNNRVQQLTVAGDYLNSFTVQRPVSIATYCDMVAVGSADGHISIRSLARDELKCCFGTQGAAAGLIGWYASGVRFSPDGTCLLVVEYNNHRLSLFSIDGVFMRNIGSGVLGDGDKDVAFGADGNIVTADYKNHRICVFSPDEGTLLNTWGTQDTLFGKFNLPHALAVSGSFLYVMDNTRVQVFE
jgi:DNA-binding beta-propeller fold protein YncE